MKRKAFIIVENAPYPADPRVRNEALALFNNGYEVIVLCPRDSDGPQGHQVIEGIRVYRRPQVKHRGTRLGYLLEYCVALFWEFFYALWVYLRHGFHIIQGCNPPDLIFLIALPFRLLGVKYIFDHHDVNPELYVSKYDKKGPLYKALVAVERLCYRFSDVVMATNASYRDLALSRGGIGPEDDFIVRNGATESFTTVSQDPSLRSGKAYLIVYVVAKAVQDDLGILLNAALRV